MFDPAQSEHEFSIIEDPPPFERENGGSWEMHPRHRPSCNSQTIFALLIKPSDFTFNCLHFHSSLHVAGCGQKHTDYESVQNPQNFKS